jgi:cation-transporting ATPase 13A1
VWVQITSEDLVPGDVFSLRNEGNEEVSVPCDILLLHGAAVLNEASLTGESTPQMKEGVTAEGESAKERLDITQVQWHKQCITIAY